jgi:uncharacterized protein
MPRIVHFEQMYDDPQMAIDFYKAVFGWEAEEYKGGKGQYWMIKTGPDGEMGINGGFMKTIPDMPGMPNVSNTIGVDDIDEYIKKVEAAGGKQVSPKMSIPGMGWSAYCQDAGGVIFGLYQTDMNAK